jgi:hypothetical protein
VKTEHKSIETVYGLPAGEIYEPAEIEPQDVYGPLHEDLVD